MTTLRRFHQSSVSKKHDYSPLILERRRSLFPTSDCDVDFELGHIRPLNSDTTSSSDEEGANISDYDVLGVMNKEGLDTPTSKEFSDSLSPLCLSPLTQAKEGTQKRFSPSQNLKTPHDTSSKANLPKLQRELLEECKSSKRNISCLDSPREDNHYKQERRSGKVRTALFSSESDISLSAKTFYPKSDEKVLEKISIGRQQPTSKPAKVMSTKHFRRYNRKFGQINNGVRHKIRKPKQKKHTTTAYTKVTKKLLKSSAAALNEYIQDIVEMKKLQSTSGFIKTDNKELENEDPIIDYVKDLQTIDTRTRLITNVVKPLQEIDQNKENFCLENRKRPPSPIEESESNSRKFFKSAKKDRVSLRNKIDNTSKQTNQNVNKVSNVITESTRNRVEKDNPSDFTIEDDTEIIPNLNIDNILSLLSQQSPEKANTLDNLEEINLANNVSNTESFITNNSIQGLQNCNTSEQFIEPHNLICKSSIQLDHTTQVDALYLTENYLTEINEVSCVDNIPSELQNITALSRPSLHNFNEICQENQMEIQPNTLVFTAHSSILASENAIQLHSNIANTILSPISQMCDVTSGLALDSPKKGRNLTNVLNGMPSANNQTFGFKSTTDYTTNMEQKKFYPIFNGKVKPAISLRDKRTKIDDKKPAKKFKALPEDQMLLDAGQKKFGYTLCAECNLVYHMGDPGDEIEHMNYHNSSHILRFAGWKNEHLIADYNKNGRIIRILSTDSKVWLKKVKELMQVITRDLGSPDMNYDDSSSQVYLYIKNRTIAGCVVATVPNSRGHKMLGNTDSVALCSEESYPIKCGISHIWVAPNTRKQGIASALMDAVKRNFITGSILNNNDIAVTSPTDAGAAFASKYFKTPNYLIYYI